MRPIKLTFEGFGPYVNKTVIEFEKLGKSGLYLITGATGAGKTTVFDAIKYALYGDASGNARAVSMLRSTLAGADIPTYVELEFEYQGKCYFVRRSPEYERIAKKGDGVATAKAEAVLVLPDGTKLSGAKSVDPKLGEILNINADQFSQIVMLAQGEFRKLLFSSTREKLEIMRKLFNTDKYFILQNEIKKELRDLTDKTRSIFDQNKKFRAGFLYPDDAGNVAECKGVASDALNDDDALEIINKVIDADEALLKGYDSEGRELDAEINKVTQILTKIEAREKLETQKEKLTSQKTEADGKKESLDKALDEAKSHSDEINKLLGDVAVLNEKLPLYQKIAERESALSQREQKLAVSTRQENSLRESADKLETTLKTDKEEQGTLSNVSADLSKKEREHDDLERQVKAVEEIESAIAERDKAEKELNAAQQSVKDAHKVQVEASKAYDDAYTLFIAEQAGLLAESLTEGMACPVCGSTEHPHVAVKSEGAPTKEQLESLKKKKESKLEVETIESQKCSGLKGAFGEKELTLKEAIEKLWGDSVSIAEAKDKCKTENDNLQSAIKGCDVEITELKKKVDRKNELDKSVPEDEKRLSDIRTELQNVEKQNASENSAIGAEKASIAEKKKSLQYSSVEEAKAKINRLSGEAGRLQKAIDDAQKAVNDNVQQISEIAGSLTQIEKSLSEAVKDLREPVEEKKRWIEAKKSDLADKIKSVSGRKKANENISNSISDNIKKNLALLEERKWKEDLAKGIASDALSIETFVQTKFFEKILSIANVKLMQMTGNRYEMRRSVNESGGGMHGLEIDVIDHYNGTRRHIKSVSGGESFMASLSLALGMSEYIQMQSGGIKLDAMFVDEGFGSLDSNALNRAVETLTHLSDSGLLIGIISHVDALEKRIDKRLVVEKDQFGSSTARLIV